MAHVVGPYILIAVFAYWFAGMSNVPDYIKRVLFNFGIKKKIYRGDVEIGTANVRLIPIDCEKCLSFWIALIYGIFHYSDWFIIIIWAGVCSLCAMVTKLLIDKLR